MRFNKIIFTTVAILLLTGACKKTEKTEEDKQPSADFTTDKAEYTAGDTIRLINKSSDVDSYRWTFPNGETSKLSNASYPTDVSAPKGQMLFKLEVFSKNNTKTDYTTKLVQINPADGQLIIFTSMPDYTGFIYIDNEYKGNLLLRHSSIIPACGNTNFLNYTLTVGTHTINAGGSIRTVDIKANKCSPLGIL